MTNLTSWFFQRAKDREQQRSRHWRDVGDDDESENRPGRYRYGRGRGLPADPIYEFLRHRAAWRRSAEYELWIHTDAVKKM